MSPVKKASAVSGLRKAVTAPAGMDREQEAAAFIAGTTPGQRAVREALKPKPVRITLDLDPEAYAALNRWLGAAAAEVGAPVSKAQALRAMIKAVSLDSSVGPVVTDLLRRSG